MADRFFDGQFYKRSTIFNYSETDTKKRVFLHKLLGEFSEIAGDECESKGQNHRFFMENGVVFIVTRMSLRVHRRPVQGEKAVYVTWFRKVEGMFFLRDCNVMSEDGELLVSMSGSWALIDLATHSLTGVESYPGTNSEAYPNIIADAPECKKINSPMPGEFLCERPVLYSDLDCNDHVNNSVYNRMALDALPPEYRESEVRDYIINFNRETRLGQVIEMRGCPTEKGYIVEGYVDGIRHFAAEYTFS